MGNVSVQEVRDLVIDRLVSGVYSLTSKLPTTRELARETGAHRNTVAKAYQALAEMGLVTLRQGRGTYVTGVVNGANHMPLVEQIRDEVADLIFKSRRLGISRDQLQAIVDQEIGAQYAANTLRAAFVECNHEDTAAAVAEIETLTGLRVAPLLLDTLIARTARVVADYDVLLTSLFHVKEVSTLVAEIAPDVKTVGVYTQPDEDALNEIAQIPIGSCAAVVVSNEDGGRRFELQIQTVAAIHTRCLVNPDLEALRAAAPTVDAVISSRSQATKVTAANLGKPLIVLPFHITQQSAAKIVDALVEPQEIVAG